MGGNIEDTASFAMIGLVRHTLLNSTVTFDVHNIAVLEDTHVGGQWDDTMLAEGAREHVSGAATITLGISHVVVCGSLLENTVHAVV
uniref:Uncharacterized protein n=1 Tax=Haematobia irritans TaxID=7368 RepID=A0A1L8E9S8_HAEIR